MRKLIVFCLLITVVTAHSYAQDAARKIENPTDSISIKKVFGGYQFYQEGKRLNMKQLVNTMKPNEQAYQMIKSAQSTNTIATILGFAGGFMVGWTLGTSLGGGDPNWTVAGIGAGLIIVAIPVSQKFNKKARQAVNTYNSQLQASSFWNKNELRFLTTGNGVGFVLNF